MWIDVGTHKASSGPLNTIKEPLITYRTCFEFGPSAVCELPWFVANVVATINAIIFCLPLFFLALYLSHSGSGILHAAFIVFSFHNQT